MVLMLRRFFSQNQGKYGYATGGSGILSAKLITAMNQTDVAIQSFLTSMATAGTLNTTAIVITAKHGQTPLDPAAVRSWSHRRAANTAVHACAIDASRAFLSCSRVAVCVARERSTRAEHCITCHSAVLLCTPSSHRGRFS